jgi:hypothetical protein
LSVMRASTAHSTTANSMKRPEWAPPTFSVGYFDFIFYICRLRSQCLLENAQTYLRKKYHWLHSRTRGSGRGGPTRRRLAAKPWWVQPRRSPTLRPRRSAPLTRPPSPRTGSQCGREAVHAVARLPVLWGTKKIFFLNIIKNFRA